MLPALQRAYIFTFVTVNPKYLHILCYKNSLSPPEPSHIRDFLHINVSKLRKWNFL